MLVGNSMNSRRFGSSFMFPPVMSDAQSLEHRKPLPRRLCAAALAVPATGHSGQLTTLRFNDIVEV